MFTVNAFHISAAYFSSSDFSFLNSWVTDSLTYFFLAVFSLIFFFIIHFELTCSVKVYKDKTCGICAPVKMFLLSHVCIICISVCLSIKDSQLLSFRSMIYYPIQHPVWPMKIQFLCSNKL